MNTQEFGQEALKYGKIVAKFTWHYLQKLTLAAAYVVGTVIKGIFNLIRDYFNAKRVFWADMKSPTYTTEQKIAALLVAHAQEKMRSSICWACFFTPILMAILGAIGAINFNSMDDVSKNVVGGICAVLFFFIIPAAIFSYQVQKIESAIKNLTLLREGQNE